MAATKKRARKKRKIFCPKCDSMVRVSMDVNEITCSKCGHKFQITKYDEHWHHKEYYHGPATAVHF